MALNDADDAVRHRAGEQLTKSNGAVHASRLPTDATTLSAAPLEVADQGMSRLDLALLSCGIVAPLIYVATDIFLALRWRGYNYWDQTISELNAITVDPAICDEPRQRPKVASRPRIRSSLS